MKIISQMWQKMPQDKKAEYKVLSDLDRKRFDTERKKIK
jgi:hypothetical protein